MESYLSGRGFDPKETETSVSVPEFKSLSSLLDLNKKASEIEHHSSSDSVEAASDIIYEEEGCPKVEVVSIDGVPRDIVITMPDSKILKISCEY